MNHNLDKINKSELQINCIQKDVILTQDKFVIILEELSKLLDNIDKEDKEDKENERTDS
jgi:hypothetical protein